MSTGSYTAARVSLTHSVGLLESSGRVVEALVMQHTERRV